MRTQRDISFAFLRTTLNISTVSINLSPFPFRLRQHPHSLKSIRNCTTQKEKQARMAAKVFLLALCVILPALIVSAGRPARNPFIVRGKVYCDTCRAGFETSATTYIPGAKVRIECKDRNTMQLLYSKEGTTDSTGTYSILVAEDHEDQLCDAMLVSSSQHDCATVSPGRERARVILTGYNGIASNNRFVNAMGFIKEEALSGCAEVLKQYQEDDE